VLIKVLMAEEMSTLEKPRESFQGAQDAQGAHLDLSTLDNPQLLLDDAQIGNLRRCIRSPASRATQLADDEPIHKNTWI
jgi:hypothetical protein